MNRAISWGLPLLMLAVYLYLAVVLGRQLSALADGLPPFDLRVFGYDLHETRAYLRALHPDGYVLYQGPIFWTDTVFAPLMGLCLVWWMRPLRGAFGMVCVLVAMSYVAFDWGENMWVLRLLGSGPDWLALRDVAGASAFTSAKFAVFALAAVLAARQSLARRRG
ncbi:hypothetical protein [Pararhodobacter zhoushanensis]|uniref:Uncharacterized protein n=1 Tax=Pararhodobacter zhoushanensis TaxID=2479545 RepID=A0ABT3H2A7_9RHOB|nr:hypothetical protein [Pararhodobacter zhoushanensis]MCW1933965.1 hypothetical protein [Pararhodobacter zhoushanensis]